MILEELHVRMGLIIDEFEKNAAKTKKEAESIEAKFRQLKNGLAALGVFAFLKSAVAEFAVHSQSVDKLRVHVEKLGGSWEEIGPKVTAAANEIQAMTDFGDTEAIDTINSLLGYTNDYAAAMALLPDVMEIATTKSWDLKKASEQVGKAFVGDQGAISQLGVEFGLAQGQATSFGEVMETVRKQTEGAADGQHNLGRSLNLTKRAWKDFQKNVGENFSLMSGLIEKLVASMQKLSDQARIVRDSMISIFKNVKMIFKGEFKAFRESNHAIVQEAINNLGELEKKSSATILDTVRLTQGKKRQLTKKETDAEKAAHRKAEMDKIKITEMALRNQVQMGKATLDQLIDLHTSNTEKIKMLYGEMTVEYQSRLTEQLQFTEKTFEQQEALMNGFFNSFSAGFEALFTAIRTEGATAATVMEAFSRAIAKSFLNSIATAIEAEAAKGMAGYLANMLGAGPIGGAAVSAYSGPMIGVLMGLSGTVRGMAAAMAEGGVVTGPTQALIGERRDRVPELVTPLNRMDDVFARWRDTMGGGRRDGGGDGATVVKIDARGAHFMDSGFSEGRMAKKISDSLYRRQYIKK